MAAAAAFGWTSVATDEAAADGGVGDAVTCDPGLGSGPDDETGDATGCPLFGLCNVGGGGGGI